MRERPGPDPLAGVPVLHLQHGRHRPEQGVQGEGRSVSLCNINIITRISINSEANLAGQTLSSPLPLTSLLMMKTLAMLHTNLSPFLVLTDIEFPATGDQQSPAGG